MVLNQTISTQCFLLPLYLIFQQIETELVFSMNVHLAFGWSCLALIWCDLTTLRVDSKKANKLTIPAKWLVISWYKHFKIELVYCACQDPFYCSKFDLDTVSSTSLSLYFFSC